ncbi:retrovirus-related pol polyprotein from transposon TNT 1-94 [Tanacetum coccineum]
MTSAKNNTSGPVPQRQEMSVDNDTSGLILQEKQKASDYENSGHVPQLQNVGLPADKTYSSQQELEFLFSPLFEEYFSAGNSSVKKSSSLTDNSKQQETQPTVNVQQPTTPTTNVIAKEKNTNDQAKIQEGDAQIDENKFYNIFSTPVREEAESSTRYVDPSNMDTFYQPHQSEHRWTKDHPLEQVRGNPSKPVQTRRQLATNPKMCMFALTVSTAEPKNIKEAMADLAWIEGVFGSLDPKILTTPSSSPKALMNVCELHWTTVKNIRKYLPNTKDMFMVYGGDMKRELKVSCYTDADVEYITAFDALKEAVWIRKIIYWLGVVPTIEEPINMYCDNTGAIEIAKDYGVTKGARHFRAKVHYLREAIEMGDVRIEKVHTYDNLADPFTKALPYPKHSELTRNIGMIPTRCSHKTRKQFLSLKCLFFRLRRNSSFLLGGEIVPSSRGKIILVFGRCEIANERLQQGKSLNIQDVTTNLFWEFGKFTSRDGESIESYYSRIYKMMNEMIRNNLQVTTMQVNVQFLQQLQLEWSRFVKIVKQTKELDTVSYHTLFDILKQYQNKVNEIHAERIAKSANPLALVAAAQQYPETYHQAPKSQRSYAPAPKQSFSTRSNASTRHKGKEIAKPVTSPSESDFDEDIVPEQAKKDKEMQKKNGSHCKSGQFGNQRTMTVAGARETVGSHVVQQTGIQCFNCKEFGHFAKECKKTKEVEQVDWLEDTDEEIDEQELEAHYSYMAKIQEVLPADFDTNAEPLAEVQYDDEYNVFANERPEHINDTHVLEKDDSNVTPDSSNMCNNDNQVDQNAAECDDERVALANLIANLKLDVDENKKIHRQLKKANASLTQELLLIKLGKKHTYDRFRAPTALDMEVLIKTCLMPLLIKTQNASFTFVHELKKEMHKDFKYVESLEKEIDELESDKSDFSNMYDLLLLECVSKDVMCSYLHYLSDLDAYTELQCLYLHKVKECEYLAEKIEETKFDAPSVVRQPNAQRIPKPSVLGKPTPFSNSLARTSFSKNESVSKTNVSEGTSKPVTAQLLPKTASQAVRNTNVIKPGMYRITTSITQTKTPQLPQTFRNSNPHVSTSTGVNHSTSVSRP